MVLALQPGCAAVCALRSEQYPANATLPLEDQPQLRALGYAAVLLLIPRSFILLCCNGVKFCVLVPLHAEG